MSESVPSIKYQRFSWHQIMRTIVPYAFCWASFIMAYLVGNRDANKGFEAFNWVTALFVIPLILQPLGVFFLYPKLIRDDSIKEFYEFYQFHITISVVSYNLLWILYSITYQNRVLYSRFNWALFSYVPLLLIVVLLYPVFIMTYALIKTPDSAAPLKRITSLKEGASKVPFGAIIFLFMLFLVTSYHIGFALAFHDQGQIYKNDHPALYMAKLSPPNLSTQQGIDYSINTNDILKQQIRLELEQTYRIFFDLGQTTPSFNEPASYDSFPKQSHDNLDKAWVGVSNRNQLNSMVEAIRREISKGKGLKILISGSADLNTPTASMTYSSNYELAEARAQNMKSRIMRELSEGRNTWQNIEWVFISITQKPIKEQQDEFSDTMMQQIIEEIETEASIEKDILDSKLNQKQMVGEKEEAELVEARTRLENLLTQIRILKDEKKYLSPDARKRNVTVRIKPTENSVQFSSLGLMDYMYFSLTTITSTGYGDIIPITTYAKFLTSFGSILEILFLVSLFNALLSVRSDKQATRLPLNDE